MRGTGRHQPILRRGDGMLNMDKGTRRDLLGNPAEAIESVTAAHPAWIAIYRPNAAGKTTLAYELAVTLPARRGEVIRASIDGLHRPGAERYRRGEVSAEGCYHDTLRLRRATPGAACTPALLVPLGPDGDRRNRTALFDHRTDAGLSAQARPHPQTQYCSSTAVPGSARS